MRRSCHDEFGPPLCAQVGLNEEVGRFVPSAGGCEAGTDGCEAAMEHIRSGLLRLRCGPVGVRVGTVDVRDRSAGCDPVTEDYIKDGETYQQLQSSNDAGQ